MNEQQQMIKDALERLLTDLCTADVVNAAEAGEWPEELWQALTETGLTLAGISEQTGGTGGDVTDSLLVIREAARFAAPVPLAEHFLAARLLESTAMTVSQPVMTVAIGEFEFNSDGRLTGQADHVAFARWADEIILVAVRKSRPFVCRVDSNAPAIIRPRKAAPISNKRLSESSGASAKLPSGKFRSTLIASTGSPARFVPRVISMSEVLTRQTNGRLFLTATRMISSAHRPKATWSACPVKRPSELNSNSPIATVITG